MTQKEVNNLSPFLQAAVALDNDLSQLVRIAQGLEAQKIDTDKGLDRSTKLLSQFDECRRRIGADMSRLGQTLEDARNQIETTTTTAEERAVEVHERHQLAEQLLMRFRNLGEMVGAVTASAGELGQSFKQEDKQAETTARLADLTNRLDELVADTCQLKEDATKANMRNLERSADSLRQKLQVTSKRLSSFAENSSLLH